MLLEDICTEQYQKKVSSCSLDSTGFFVRFELLLDQPLSSYNLPDMLTTESGQHFIITPANKVIGVYMNTLVCLSKCLIACTITDMKTQNLIRSYKVCNHFVLKTVLHFPVFCSLTGS